MSLEYTLSIVESLPTVDLNTCTLTQLRERIGLYNTLYYKHSYSAISDQAFDALEEIYREKAETESRMVLTVGSDIRGNKKLCRHPTKMYSLRNSFSGADVDTFFILAGEEIGEEVQLAVEEKLDGVPLNLVYINGVLDTAITRGDGEYGEDTTRIAKRIPNIPSVVHEFADLGTIQVRGECAISKLWFTKENKRLIAEDKDPMSNPRNTTSGALKRSKINKDMIDNISFMAFAAEREHPTLNAQCEWMNSHMSIRAYLRKCGFMLPRSMFIDDVGQLTIENTIHFMGEHRNSSDYDIDGLVFKIAQTRQQVKLGFTGKDPRWAAAYKYPEEEVITTVEDIVLQVGRSGVVTPVGKTTPVVCGGVIVSSINLANQAKCDRLGIRIGGEVVIKRAGEVIPDIVRSIGNETSSTQRYQMPSKCPECDSYLMYDRKRALCTNKLECPAQILAKFEHFVSRGGMYIDGLGPSTLESLIKVGLLSDYVDIYKLTAPALINELGMSDHSAEKLIASISVSKDVSIAKFLYAYGFEGIGKTSATELGAMCMDIRTLPSIPIDRLRRIKGFGVKTTKALQDHFKTEKNLLAFKELISFLNIKSEKVVSGKLYKRNIAITGSFEDGTTRDDVIAIIKRHAGTVSSSVNKKTALLVVGSGGAGKLKKATSLGIETITLEQLRGMVNE